MAFPDDQMTEVLTVTTRTGVTGYGVTVSGESVDEYWYLETGFKLVTNDRGEEVTATLFGIGPSDSVLAVGDEVTWNARTYRAIDVQPCSLEGVAHHTEAAFGSVAS